MSGKSTVKHDAAVDAALNAPEQITLYHTNGKQITVDSGDLPFWLDQGFRQSKADPEQTAAELKAVFPEALDAVMRYVAGVTEGGLIDSADDAAQATAQQAMRKLEMLWGQLVRDVEALYPVRQGDGVKMEKDGATIEVDPTQIEHYEGQGWVK